LPRLEITSGYALGDRIGQSYRTRWIIIDGSRLLGTLVCKLVAEYTAVSWHPLNVNVLYVGDC